MIDSLAADGFGYWLAGFIDGEAYFHVAKAGPSAGKPRYSVKLEISLRDDDAMILHEIAERTGIGKVQYHRSRQPGCGNVARWVVGRREEIATICEILDRFPLRAKKQTDYEIWRAAAACWMGVRLGGGNEGIWRRMEELRDLLMDSRTYAFA